MAKRTDAQIVAEHQKRYSTARGFLAKAEASVRYWSKRAGSSHGKEMLQAAVARREVRRKQVADELKIIERHRDHTVSSVSAEGLAFVAGQEGFVANVYRDAVGVATQGYGETHGITPGRAWTREYALQRLKTRINDDYLAPVLRFCRAHGFEPNQAEADALASFAYNLGAGVFSEHTDIGRAIMSHDRQRIANTLLEYDKAGGHALLGLTLRRRKERSMFLNAK
jgi:lysozyme